MDRRQKKTRESIFKAFSSLLETERYEHITVQDIIDKADIGRSTFYAHFETKDMLLKEMCHSIFNHIFDNELCSYKGDKKDLQSRLAHILWHFKEIEKDIVGILSSGSGELFMGYLKENLNLLFKMYLADFKTDVPADFLLNYLVGSFCETVKWWVGGKMTEPPETVANYFMAVIETH